MAIKGWSDTPQRIVRVGKIGLGYADTDANGKKRLKRADHFVVNENVAKVYGDKPTELDICFPSDDFEVVFPTDLKRYSDKFGLICKGNGITAKIPISYPFISEYGISVNGTSCADSKTGEKLPTIDEGNKKYVQLSCAYKECPMYKNKKCSEVGILNIILYKVQGLGVYALATKSYNSYQNIKAAFFHLKEIIGRASFIPVKLQVKVEDKKPTIMMGGKLTQVPTKQPILHVAVEHSIEELLQMVRSGQIMSSLPATLQGAKDTGILLEPPDEEKPELLYPDIDDDGVVIDVDSDGNPMSFREKVVSGGENEPVAFNPEPPTTKPQESPQKETAQDVPQKTTSQNTTSQFRKFQVRINKIPAKPINTNIGGMPGLKHICHVERPIMAKGKKIMAKGFLVIPSTDENNQFVAGLKEKQVVAVMGSLLDPKKADNFTLIVENATAESVA